MYDFINLPIPCEFCSIVNPTGYMTDVIPTYCSGETCIIITGAAMHSSILPVYCHCFLMMVCSFSTSGISASKLILDSVFHVLVCGICRM